MSDYEFLKKTLKQDYSEDFMQPIFDLIDKDTPMKPILKDYEFLCPKCNEVVGYYDSKDTANYRDNYCFNCGKKLGDK